MAGYIGSKAVLLSTTGADIAGDANIDGDLTVDTNTLHVDSTNNRVGIGTSSPSALLHLESAGPSIKLVDNDNNPDYQIKNGNGSFRIIDTTAGSDRISISAAGNVGIGEAPSVWRSADRALVVGNGASQYGNYVSEGLGVTYGSGWYRDTSGNFKYTLTGYPAGRFDFNYTGANVFSWHQAAAGTAGNNISFSEAMRIDSSGTLLHGKTTTSETVLGTKIELNSGGGRIIVTGNGGSGGALFLGNNTTGNVGLMRENGDFECVNNSYTGFSDVRLKENIENSGSQWEDIKALRVRKFSFIRDNVDAPDKIGVIAQELEGSGMSGLVSTNPDLSNPDETIKTVKYSILYMKAVKALQEAMERIETLEAEQTTIKARLDALETP